jgi:hypothetical protein
MGPKTGPDRIEKSKFREPKNKNKLRGPLSASELYRLRNRRRRNLVPTFVDRGVSRGQRGRSPTVVILSFLDRGCYFAFR